MTLKSASGPPRHRIAKRDEHARLSRDPGAEATVLMPPGDTSERSTGRSARTELLDGRRQAPPDEATARRGRRPRSSVLCAAMAEQRFLCERKTARQKFRTALRVMDRPKPIARTQSIDPNTYSSKRGAIDWPTSGLCSTNESVMRRTVADPTHPILPWAFSRSRRNNPCEHGAVLASCRPIAEAAGLDETAGLDVKDRSETLPKK